MRSSLACAVRGPHDAHRERLELDTVHDRALARVGQYAARAARDVGVRGYAASMPNRNALARSAARLTSALVPHVQRRVKIDQVRAALRILVLLRRGSACRISRRGAPRQEQSANHPVLLEFSDFLSETGTEGKRRASSD